MLRNSGGGYAKRIATWEVEKLKVPVAVRKAHHHVGSKQVHNSGGDALGGNTRSHPEHDKVKT